jgi:hypothetical protein
LQASKQSISPAGRITAPLVQTPSTLWVVCRLAGFALGAPPCIVNTNLNQNQNKQTNKQTNKQKGCCGSIPSTLATARQATGRHEFH